MSRRAKVWTDKQLVEFSTAFRDGILEDHLPTLACFMVSAPLAALLQIHGVQCDLVESDLGWCNHVWIRLADGRALDPTADQFNYLDRAKMPMVYLGPPTKYHTEPRP